MRPLEWVITQTLHLYGTKITRVWTLELSACANTNYLKGLSRSWRVMAALRLTQLVTRSHFNTLGGLFQPTVCHLVGRVRLSSPFRSFEAMVSIRLTKLITYC